MMEGLFEIGVVDKWMMCEFDEVCLMFVEVFFFDEICLICE